TSDTAQGERVEAREAEIARGSEPARQGKARRRDRHDRGDDLGEVVAAQGPVEQETGQRNGGEGEQEPEPANSPIREAEAAAQPIIAAALLPSRLSPLRRPPIPRASAAPHGQPP